MQPKVSVVIPVYNRADLIVRCVESARAQTHANLEIIINDNASTDDTWAVVNRLAAADPRIRPFRNDVNLGPTRNWMRALERCTGDYVKILWSDDWIEPTFIAEVLAQMAKEPDAGLGFSATLIHFADRDSPFYHFPKRTSFTTTAYLRDSLLGDRMPVSPGCALVRREFARFRLPIGDGPELNRIAERYGAGPDLLFLLDAAAQSGRVAYVPKFLCHFWAGQTSITQNHPRDVLTAYRLVREVFAAEMVPRSGLGQIKTRLNVRRWQRTLKRAFLFESLRKAS